MKKASNIIALIVGIIALVVGIGGIAAIIMSLVNYGFDLFSAYVFPIILCVAEIVFGILVISTSKKSFVVSIVFTAVLAVIILLDMVVQGGQGGFVLTGAFLMGLAQATFFYTLFQILGWCSFVALLAAIVLRSVDKALGKN